MSKKEDSYERAFQAAACIAGFFAVVCAWLFSEIQDRNLIIHTKQREIIRLREYEVIEFKGMHGHEFTRRGSDLGTVQHKEGCLVCKREWINANYDFETVSTGEGNMTIGVKRIPKDSLATKK